MKMTIERASRLLSANEKKVSAFLRRMDRERDLISIKISRSAKFKNGDIVSIRDVNTNRKQFLVVSGAGLWHSSAGVEMYYTATVCTKKGFHRGRQHRFSSKRIDKDAVLVSTMEQRVTEIKKDLEGE